jgi:anti-anti-sigma factor
MPVRSAPGTAVVAIEGSIDPRNLSSLASALDSVSGRGYRTLIFDLQGIRYINSAGLAYLVNLSDHLEARGGGMLLANPQAKVKLVLEMMGLTEFFKLYKTVDSALAVVSKSRPTSTPSRATR